MNREAYIIRRIELIERELRDLKQFIAGDNGQIVSLRGIWEGADISDEEIEEAKRSLSKGIEIDDSN